jgi:hypothetical protein
MGPCPYNISMYAGSKNISWYGKGKGKVVPVLN